MAVLPFPADRRRLDVKRCAIRLSNIHGEDADLFWRAEMAGFVTTLRGAGANDAEIRQQAVLFLRAVQDELEQVVVSKPA